MTTDNTNSPETDDNVSFSRTGTSDIFGKLDCELPTLRFNSEAEMELERRWRASGLGSKSEYIRIVLYVNLFGEEHIANLQAQRMRRAIGNATALPRKEEVTA